MHTGHIVKGQRVEETKVQRAKELRREMTPEERVLWKKLRLLRERGLPFRRQQVIDGFIVDFYCHSAGLVIEVDGPYHERQPEYDAERDQILAARGLQILRFTNDQIRRDLRNSLTKIITVANAETSPPLPAGEGVGG